MLEWRLMSDLIRSDELAQIDAARDPDRWLSMLRGMWPGNDEKRRRYRRLFRSVAGGPGIRVLEVGCGAGGALRFFIECVPDAALAVGVDPSCMALAEAIRGVPDEAAVREPIPEFLAMDGRYLAFPDRTFDVVYCSRVLVHAPEPERILDEMVRVLKIGGTILVVEPDRDGMLSSAEYDWINRRFWSHLRSLNPEIGRRVYRQLHRVGLAEIQVESVFNVTTRPPTREQVREVECALSEKRGEYWTLVELGLCTADELTKYVEALREAEESGVYLRSDLEFVYRARRVR